MSGYGSRVVVLAVGFALAWWPGRAGATFVNFLDLTDTVTIASDTGTGTSSGEFATFTDTIAHAFTLNPAPPVIVAVLLTEGADVTSAISDVVELTLTDSSFSTSLKISFTSDTEGGPGLAYSGVFVKVPETGLLQPLTPTFRGIGTVGTLLPATYLIGAQSDIEPVPEPSSLALTGLGLTGLGALAVRRRARHGA